MKNQKRFILGMFTILLFASLQVAVLGQGGQSRQRPRRGNGRQI